MIKLEDLSNDVFSISHLSELDVDEISNFTVNNPKGKGLEDYIKHYALQDEVLGYARTYLIRDASSNYIVAYFTLRTGLVTVSRGLFKGFDTVTGIELANFAVNDEYRDYCDVIPQIGSFIFNEFILPLVKKISMYVGAHLLYIYALPHYKLMEHYRTMGFNTTSYKAELFVYRHVKPAYDKSCRFMFQKI